MFAYNFDRKINQKVDLKMYNLNFHRCIELTQGEENQCPAKTGSSDDVTTLP